MPRRKVVLEPHPAKQARMQCYLTRRNGIKKKVRELSILCDADIAHLSIPPVGEPSLFLGEHTNLLSILDRFANIDPIIRERRRRQVIDSLKNGYRKRGHEISTDSLLQYNMSGSEEADECRNRIRQVQEKIDAVNRNLSHWRNPGAINDIFEVIVKEEILHNSLKLVRKQKARLEQRNGASDSTNLEVPYFAFTQHSNPQPVQGALCPELPQRESAHQNASGGPVGIGAGFNLPLSRQIIQNSLGQENPTNLEALMSEYLVNPNHTPSNEVSNNLLPQRVSSFPGMSDVPIVDFISDSSFHSQRQITRSATNHELPASTGACLEKRFGVSNSNTSEVPCFDFAPISSQPLEGILNQVPCDQDVVLPPLPEVFVETADNGAGSNLQQYDQTAQNLLSHVYPTNLETWRPIAVDRPWEGVFNYVPSQQDSNLLVPSWWENTNMQGPGHIQTCNRDFNFCSSHNRAALGSVGPENLRGAGSFADDPYINSNSTSHFESGNLLFHHNDLFHF